MLGCLPAARADDPKALAADESLFRAAKLGTTGESLTKFFRTRVPTAQAEKEVARLISELGHRTFRVREKASEGLLTIGPVALGPLRAVTDHEDPEVARRARDCVEALEKTAKP